VGGLPYAVVVGDFNNDGKQDLATSRNGGNIIAIRLGDGAGGFSGTGTVSAGDKPCI